MTRRNQSLDVLRGIAILLVIAFHLDPFGVWRIGYLGVDLFFVLSGFLISGLLFRDFEKHAEVRLASFWIRRAFKILPPLYVFLAAMALLMWAFRIFPSKRFFAAVFLFSNYLADPNQAGLLVGHTWSLAIEEHFYLLCPLLLWALARYGGSANHFRCVPLIYALVAVSCFTFRCLDPNHWAFTHLRLDALFTGVTLRYLERFRPKWFGQLRTPISLLIGLTFWVLPFAISSSGPIFHSFTYTWTNISVACLVGWCFNHDANKWWGISPVRRVAAIGFYSYSIYLWQAPFCLLALGKRWGFTAVGLVCSLAVGVVMAKLVEVPTLALRDRLLTAAPKAEPQLGFASAALPARIQN